jgi:hypothetical protein
MHSSKMKNRKISWLIFLTTFILLFGLCCGFHDSDYDPRLRGLADDSEMRGKFYIYYNKSNFT